MRQPAPEEARSALTFSMRFAAEHDGLGREADARRHVEASPTEGTASRMRDSTTSGANAPVRRDARKPVELELRRRQLRVHARSRHPKTAEASPDNLSARSSGPIWIARALGRHGATASASCAPPPSMAPRAAPCRRACSRAGRATVAMPSKSGRRFCRLESAVEVDRQRPVGGDEASPSSSCRPASMAPVVILAVWRTPATSSPPSALYGPEQRARLADEVDALEPQVLRRVAH